MAMVIVLSVLKFKSHIDYLFFGQDFYFALNALHKYPPKKISDLLTMIANLQLK